MRIILLLWAVPLCLFWGWYTLSFYDISFGTVFFSRGLHDLVFKLYGQTLGVPASEVPAMVAWACALDTTLIGGLAAWRWRKGWYPQAAAYLSGLFVAPVDVSQEATPSQTGIPVNGPANDNKPKSLAVALAPTALPAGPVLPAE